VHATGLYTDCEEQSVVRPLPYDLTAEQKAACDRILSAPGAYVVFGATGSGKTEVYMNVAKAHLEKGGGAIILIPEISLTPQTVKRFRERFGNDVAVIHSGLNREEKYQEWIKIKTGKARLAVGARSCIFAPIRNLSLVVIDEEHDRAYKQDEDPKYHAREVALFRSPTVVMGSATPSVETFQRARDGEFQLIAMEKRVPGSSFPRTTVVDMREELSAGNRTIFSRALSQAMGSRLSRHEQSILLLNRRGYSTFLLCRDCGHVIKCPWCDVSLVYHSSENRLRCHYCDYVRKLPETCPNCGSRHIRSFGTGTEKVVAEVQRTTPEARVLRMDSDTTRTRGGHELILKAFSERQADILVGTQMVAKGHDIPGVTLVGIINADTSLNFPDFRAAERTYQLIAQVSGRSGRGSLPGEVLIQTYMPDHYAIVSAASLDYHGFYQKEIESRRDLGYPPFGRLMLVSIRGGTAAECEETGKGVVSTLMDSDLKPSLDILGPAPCAVSKVKRVLRWQVLVKARDLSALKGAGRLLSSRFRHDRVAIDIDPENVI
jgi:primosomal protein N' (replication factor Y)